MKKLVSAATAPVTVVDVAKEAGVSPGTVSNYLSGKRRVVDTTSEKVAAAIQKLGYVPNPMARGMRTGRVNTLALFSSMPSSIAAGPSRLGFLMEIAASVAMAALEHDCALLLVPPIKETGGILGSTAFDGAIILEPDSNDPLLEPASRRGVPTVCIGRPPQSDIAFIDLDYRTMASLLIDELESAGAKRFPLITSLADRQTNRDFADIYRERTERPGRYSRIVKIAEEEAEQSAAKAILEMLTEDQEIDGVLVPIDAMASGVMTGLRQAGRSVPDDVRVVTRYDGLRARSETPPLTALNLHLETVAAMAVDQLMLLVDGQTTAASSPPPAPELIRRASTTTITIAQ